MLRTHSSFSRAQVFCGRLDMGLETSWLSFMWNFLSLVKFLDISAGTGLASLVALLRGWNVLSTDLLPESGQTRRMSAMASFGQNSSVLDRLQIAELDLLDASTWPSHTTPHAYHVIGGSSITHVRGKQSFEFAFRKLVAANLAPRGVGLYTFTFEAAEADRIRQTLTESSTICLWI
eukprot:Skav235850  [mRNA]  locus=scaffold2644:13038:16708:+ [translate_table: standard]